MLTPGPRGALVRLLSPKPFSAIPASCYLGYIWLFPSWVCSLSGPAMPFDRLAPLVLLACLYPWPSSLKALPPHPFPPGHLSQLLRILCLVFGPSSRRAGTLPVLFSSVFIGPRIEPSTQQILSDHLRINKPAQSVCLTISVTLTTHHKSLSTGNIIFTFVYLFSSPELYTSLSAI